MKQIFTIGHSNRSIDDFIELLKINNIIALADVRSYPGSRWFPWFNREKLSAALQKEDIQYIHIPELGGRGHIKKGGPATNTLATYEAHMHSDTFRTGIDKLTTIATAGNTAIMCAEADWQKCHRQFIAAYLFDKEWKVFHIKKGDLEVHFNEPKQGNLFK